MNDQDRDSANQSQKHSSGERIESPRPALEQGLLARVDALRTEERNEPREDGYDFYICDAVYETLKEYIPIMERYVQPHLALSGDAGITFAFGRHPCVRVAFRGGGGPHYIYYENPDDTYGAIELTKDNLELKLNKWTLATVNVPASEEDQKI